MVLSAVGGVMFIILKIHTNTFEFTQNTDTNSPREARADTKSLMSNRKFYPSILVARYLEFQRSRLMGFAICRKHYSSLELVPAHGNAWVIQKYKMSVKGQ